MVPPSPCTTRSRNGLSVSLTESCQLSCASAISANGIRKSDAEKA